MTRRALVVEDEAISAMAISMMMEASGCEVVAVADSGQEAIDLATALRPDLVLMDIRLKGAMSGIDSARTIRTRLGIPVIITTAYTADEIRRSHALDDSFILVSKPIQEHELLHAVSAVCG